jgi:hypothetical protein
MDLAKFVWMLEKQSLYLSSIKKLRENDPYEGRFTTYQAKMLAKLESAPIEVRRAAIDPSLKMSDDDVNGLFTALRAAATHIDNAGTGVAVNCWHVNDSESDAMWRLYSLQGQGIAIQSTYDRLERSFHMAQAQVEIGMVTYHDYDTHAISMGNVFHVAMTKRTSFEHEKELRVATLVPSGFNPALPQVDGIEVQVDIEILIEKIVVSPKSPPWHAALIASLMKRYGLDDGLLTLSPLYTHIV